MYLYYNTHAGTRSTFTQFVSVVVTNEFKLQSLTQYFDNHRNIILRADICRPIISFILRVVGIAAEYM